MKPRVRDFFSGIGGFALAFEAAGCQIVSFAEIEPYPCKVLAQHWPTVPNLGDVRQINGEDYRGTTDVVCGGFPCQDISTAGKGAGIEGARSGLWFEMLRIIRGARPAFCLIENVPALRTRGADVVLEGLEETGYACRAFVVGAGNAGAPHKRARAWLVAYDQSQGRQRLSDAEWTQICHPARRCESVGVLDSDANGQGSQDVSREPAPAQSHWRPESNHHNWWSTEPALDRVVHGLPHRAHRIKALGNSIVPAVAYPFARWIKLMLDGAGPGEKPPEGATEDQCRGQ